MLFRSMTTIEYRDSDIRSNELETGLSSSGESFDKDFEIVMQNLHRLQNPPFLQKFLRLQSPFMLSLSLAF